MPEGYLPIQQRTQERIVARTHFRVERHPTVQHPVPNGQDTRPGHCPRQQLIGQRPSMIDQAREVFCQGRFPASLIYALIVSPSPAVPSTFRPLASGNTSACRPVVLDTALLPRPFLPPSAKETRCDCLCPDGSSLHGNAANIAARLAAQDLLGSSALHEENHSYCSDGRRKLACFGE